MKKFILYLCLLIGFSTLSAQPDFSFSTLAQVDETYEGHLGINTAMHSDLVRLELQGFGNHRIQMFQAKVGINILPKVLPFDITLYPFYFETTYKDGYITPTELKLGKDYKNIAFNFSVMHYESKDFGFRGGVNYTVFSTKPKFDSAFSKNQIIGMSLSFIGGFIHGTREMYHADPHVFEKAFNVHPESFWGSDSWKRKYKKVNGKYDYSQERRAYTSISDYWHTSGWLSKGLIMSGTTVLILDKPYCEIHKHKHCSHSKINIKKVAKDFILSFAASSLGSWAGYQSLYFVANK